MDEDLFSLTRQSEHESDSPPSSCPGDTSAGPPRDEQALEAHASESSKQLDHDLLKLALLPGLGPRSLSLLLERFGEASHVLRASKAALMEVNGVGPKLSHTIATADDHIDVDGVLEWCRGHEVQIRLRGSDGYPANFRDLDDAPPLLFSHGTWQACDELSVGIVGTRHASPYGVKQTRRLAMDLASAGVTIISGLARGVDTTAHLAALEVGGRTVAFLGGGLGEIYPPENKGLVHQIGASGSVVFSEYAPMAKPRSGMFPQRNRLIAAASLATLVIEAPQRSGSLITARLAGELGRGVGALPGPVDSRTSHGCHQLIRDGATLICHADDVLELLGCLDTGIQRPQSGTNRDNRFGDPPTAGSVSTETEPATLRDGRELSLNEIERLVLDHVAVSGTSLDEIMQQTQLPAARVAAIISILEMRRFVRRLSSQYVSRR